MLEQVRQHRSHLAGLSQKEQVCTSPGPLTRPSLYFGSSRKLQGWQWLLCGTSRLVHSFLTQCTLCLLLDKCQPQKSCPLLEKLGSFLKTLISFSVVLFPPPKGPICCSSSILFFQLYGKGRNSLVEWQPSLASEDIYEWQTRAVMLPSVSLRLPVFSLGASGMTILPQDL